MIFSVCRVRFVACLLVAVACSLLVGCSLLCSVWCVRSGVCVACCLLVVVFGVVGGIVLCDGVR